MTPDQNSVITIQRSIKRILQVFIGGLVISGVTAFPIEWELGIAYAWIQSCSCENTLTRWIELAYTGIRETNLQYPFISYGTDWLAFAHLVIAIVFIGPLRDPFKNIWVIEFGLIACAAIFPLAFIAGSVRDIPLYWRLLDCSFGLIGGCLLWICYMKIKQLEKLSALKK
ncbi:hypothetical protein [Ohtaekwangia koreensis]|uniref:Uncharacterized protein n=1 Tax=Ohtaekwangia koreensis TaxID=688867 RepID=A0A1T5KR17_9BACT|nr:hypothetical protein [Ohtaekwangia koreensis]SKC66214.1 hypothetical protein SAMN05660236_2510 [Ohtaekwangia koreensis]